MRDDWSTLHIPNSRWEACGDELAGDRHDRLLTTIVVNGCPMHLDARRIIADDGSQQAFAAGAYPDDAGPLSDALGADGPWQTIGLGDAEYVLFASPHC